MEHRPERGIFGFLTWLRVDEPREQSLAEALQAARERFPRQGEPDVSLVISHAHRIRINARDNRRLAPPVCTPPSPYTFKFRKKGNI